MKATLWGIILGTAGLFISTTLEAATIFSDGFEGVTPQALADPAKWDSTFSTNPDVAWAYVGNNATDGQTPFSGSNYLIIKRADPNLGQTKALFSGPITSGIVEVSFAYNYVVQTNPLAGYMFNFDGGSVKFESQDQQVGLHYNTGSGHTLFQKAGGGNLVSKQNNTWNTLKYTLDLNNDTVVATLNGMSSNPVAFDFGASGGFQNFWFRGAGGGQAFLADDVLITHVPEPAAIGLLALAALAAVAGRRCYR